MTGGTNNNGVPRIEPFGNRAGGCNRRLGRRFEIDGRQNSFDRVVHDMAPEGAITAAVSAAWAPRPWLT